MEAYIRNVTEQMRCVKAREGVARELSDHIADQTAAYEAAGVSHEEAVQRAVREMGDPVAVGVEMDRIHRPQTDWRMIAMAFVFSVAGFFIICRVNDLAKQPSYMIWQGVTLLLSFGVMAGIYFLDYSFIGRYAYAAAVLVTIVASAAGFVGNWIGLDRTCYMAVYLYVPVYAAVLYRLRGRGMRGVAAGIGILLAMLFPAYLFGIGFYGLVNVYMLCTLLFLTAVWKKWFAAGRKAAAAAVIGILVLLPACLLIVKVAQRGASQSFRVARLLAWLHPEQDAAGAGYYYLWVRGLWRAARLVGPVQDSAFSYDTADAIGWVTSGSEVLLTLISRYGILVVAAVMLAFAAVILRAFHIVRQQQNQLGFMMSAACFMVFFINCLQGILISSGYYPASSLPLPFISFGTGAAVTYAALIGLLLSIHRNERIVTDEAVRRQPVWRLRIKLEKR